MTTHRDVTVLAIAGSLRRDSWNRRLLDAAGAVAPAGMRVVVYRDLDRIPMLNEDLIGEDTPPALHELRQAIAAADGVLLATPEYNHSIPGVLKNLLDWLSVTQPQGSLAGKPVAVLGATPGRWGTRLAQAALRQVLVSGEALVLPSPMLFIGEVERRFGGTVADPATSEALRGLMLSFGDWIALHRQRDEHARLVSVA
jgi:chromate reductase